MAKEIFRTGKPLARGAWMSKVSERKWRQPSSAEKIALETPFLGPFLMQRGGVGGKALFVLFKLAGEIPVAGGIIESLGRRHGIVAEMPTTDFRRLLTITGVRESGRLLTRLEPLPPGRFPETGRQYVQISPEVLQLQQAQREKILKLLSGKKTYNIQRVARLPPEFKAEIFKRRSKQFLLRYKPLTRK